MLIKVAGVTFEGRQELLKEIYAVYLRLTTHDPQLSAKLQPEPANKYDPNAIKVLVKYRGAFVHVGYVPKEMAAILKDNLKGTWAKVDFMGTEPSKGMIGLRIKVWFSEPNLQMEKEHVDSSLISEKEIAVAGISGDVGRRMLEI